jgi:deoxycytidylate deaminase
MLVSQRTLIKASSPFSTTFSFLNAMSTYPSNRQRQLASIIMEIDPRKRSHLDSIYFLAHRRRISLLKVEQTVKTKKHIARETLAFITGQGDKKPKAMAMSGWTGKHMPDSCVLDSAVYTAMVKDFGRTVGFRYPPHPHDKSNKSNESSYAEICGRYFACHCEKKLALFWVNIQLRHVLGAVDYSQIGLLKTAPLPGNRRNARLYLDHKPCWNCRAFISLIEQLSGLKFTIVSRPALQLGRRDKTNFCEHCPCDGCRKKLRSHQWQLIREHGGETSEAACQDQSIQVLSQDRQDNAVSHYDPVAQAEENQAIDATCLSRISLHSTPVIVIPITVDKTPRRVPFPILTTPPRIPVQSSVPQGWCIRTNHAKPLPATPVVAAPSFLGQQYAESAAKSCSLHTETVLPSIEFDHRQFEHSSSVVRCRQLPTGHPAQAAKLPDLSEFFYTEDLGVSRLAARLHRSSLSGDESLDPRQVLAKARETKRPATDQRFQSSLLPGLVSRPNRCVKKK